MSSPVKDYDVFATTIDNPFDYFDDFVNWYMYDRALGYDTCGRIANLVKTSDQFSDAEDIEAIENAVDRLIQLDFQNIYKKVKKKREPDSLSEIEGKTISQGQN